MAQNYSKITKTALYEEILRILQDDPSTETLFFHFEENQLFQEYYLGEAWEGIQYKIPLVEWNLKTGMKVKPQCDYLHELNDLLPAYQGYIEVESDDNQEYFVCIYGTL